MRSRVPDGRHHHRIPKDPGMPRAQLPQLELFLALRQEHSGNGRSQKETNLRRTTYNPGGCLAMDPKNINHTGAKNNHPHNSNYLRTRGREASPPPPTRRWTSLAHLLRSSSQIDHHLLRGTPHPDEDSEGNHPNQQYTQHNQQLSPRRIKKSMISSPSFLPTGHRSRKGIRHPGVVCDDPGHRATRTSQTARAEQQGDEHFSQRPSMASSGTECCLEHLPVWHRGRKLGP